MARRGLCSRAWTARLHARPSECSLAAREEVRAEKFVKLLLGDVLALAPVAISSRGDVGAHEEVLATTQPMLEALSAKVHVLSAS